MPPLETPQEYYEYFQGSVLHADPPAPKWAIGLRAAQLWIAYHEHAEPNTDMLLELVQVLMPYRFAGSGFYALWLTVINSLCALPVIQQARIWQAIFDPANHGERLVPHPERAEAVIQHWKDVAQQSASTSVDLSAMEALVKTFGPDLAPAVEWLTLGYTINMWFEACLPEVSFMNLVFEQHNASIGRRTISHPGCRPTRAYSRRRYASSEIRSEMASHASAT
jgi:hypothetical protein